MSADRSHASGNGASRTLLEAALQHERLATSTLLVVIPLACWT